MNGNIRQSPAMTLPCVRQVVLHGGQYNLQDALRLDGGRGLFGRHNEGMSEGKPEHKDSDCINERTADCSSCEQSFEVSQRLRRFAGRAGEDMGEHRRLLDGDLRGSVPDDPRQGCGQERDSGAGGALLLGSYLIRRRA